ncbi:MAG: ABC-type amino acid transport substrate-binding protein [Planctomycetota bacterium]|jgi:ABC-type amino acid transport substrate-binding protein
MAQAIAELIDRDLVWRRMTFDQLLDAVEAGTIDSVVATLGITEARVERVLFSKPY